MNRRRFYFLIAGGVCVFLGLGVHAQDSAEPAKETAHVAAGSAKEVGKYLVQVGGCNDCHTAGYDLPGAVIAEDQLLKGVPVGFKGPWGTTYPSNLRLTVEKYDVDAFIKMTRNRDGRPPMPWGSLHAMSDSDLRGCTNTSKV